MPNRIIKDSIRTSRTINGLTDFQFRVWVHLITYVDDYGRGSADPELIKGIVFPRRKRIAESDIEKALADLAGMGCISLYHVDGESYFYFPKWSDHQQIRTKKSKFPPPPELDISCNQLISNVPVIQSNPIRIQSESESESKPSGCADKPHNSRFVPPTVDEVRAYCQERKNGVDPEAFVAFYASKGWMVGKSKMKDWRAAIITWERKREQERGGPDQQPERNRPRRWKTVVINGQEVDVEVTDDA